MKKILVIDDEEWLREMVQTALRHKGFDVVQAENGAVGIEMARKELPDLILCDVNMDKVNGYLTLETLRNEPATAAIPFILMTGLADNTGMRHGMELGADDYLAKPFMLDTLYAAVDARLKKAQALREEAEKKLADLRDSISLALPHELRTPLNGIMAYGEILSTDAATLKPEEVAEMGQVIHDSGKRLHRLVENFLIYARVELLGKDPQTASGLRAKRTPQPASIVEASARNQAQTAHRLGDLVLELSVGAQAGLAISEEYLTKIVDEIVHNAFKFSQPGSPVRVAFAEADGVMALTVSDHGRGMSTEHITKVGAYMQFERKLHEQQGLGLGLSIARRLTELHGGSLVIQSHPDTGTTVTVKLPAAS